jgi:hypothetical protein
MKNFAKQGAFFKNLTIYPLNRKTILLYLYFMENKPSVTEGIFASQ